MANDDWDAFGSGDDPFGVAGDVFGKELGEVDPFGGDDSFAQEGNTWGTFNDDHDHDHDDNEEKDEKTTCAARPRHSSSSRHMAENSSKRRSKKSAQSSRCLDSSSTPASAPRSPSKENSRGRHGSRGSAGEGSSRSRSKSGTPGSRSRSRSAGPGDRNPRTLSPIGARRGTKADRRKQQLQQQQHQGDPFSSNDDGFGGAPFFPADNAGNNNDDGFGFNAFADFGDADTGGGTGFETTSPDNRHRRSARLHHRSSASVGAPLTPGTPGKAASSSSTRLRSSRYRNGTASRLRPSEQQARQHESSSRRSKIQDSLMGALGDDDDNGEISLDSFFSDSKKKAPSRRSANDSRSVQSAPVLSTSRFKSSHRRPSSRDDQSTSSAGNGPPALSGKSRRYQRKMGSSLSTSGSGPGSRSNAGENKSPRKTSASDNLKIDLEELAKLGKLEMHDGKMRLVIDMDQG